MKTFILADLIGAAALGICEFSMPGIRINRGTQITQVSQPFEMRNPDAKHRILVVDHSTSNAGLSPIFWIYTARTRRARAIFIDASRDLGIQYVGLFRERGNELFRGDSDRY